MKSMIFQCDGGPGGGRRTQDQEDESYSEEEEEASSTSVESEGEDEEEEDEEEGESEEDESDSEDDEEVEEEEAMKQRPTRNSGPVPSSSSSSRSKVDSQRGRFTRQKAREQMPTKRLLRSRKKSPAAGAGSRVPQVFKCPNCKKEFNNRVSLSRHTGWCKQKSPKVSSPRKKKDVDGSTKDIHGKIEENLPSRTLNSETHSLPNGPRGRGRPRKNPVPSNSASSLINPSTSVAPQLHHHQFMQQQRHYQEDMMMGAGRLGVPPATSSSTVVEEEFMQQKSPQSSPGIMDTSSEEDYEQKEFAANAHQLMSHRNSVSIDVVNPDPPPEQMQGPVTCPQCKMTYRTLLGYQNHIPNCAPYSSDEEEDDEEEVSVIDQTDEIPRFQQPNGPNWTAHHTVPETVIAPPPPPPQPMEVESSEEETTSSSDEGGVEGNLNPSVTNVDIPVISSQPAQLQKYHEISIASTGMGKSPLKIILPPDNTPQVINASGLTLERLENSPVPKTISTNSPAAVEIHPKSSTPLSNEELRILTPQPSRFSPSVYHSQSPNQVSITPQFIASQSAYPNTQIYPPTALQVHNHLQAPSAIQISSSSLTSASTISTPKIVTNTTPSNSSVSVPLIPPVHAGGNPPTYTQAQLMPGTVLHNSIMPVPQQMTSTGEAYHLHQPASSQALSQFSSSHFPICYTTQAASAPQSTFRVQNSIPSVHSTPPGGLPPHSGIFIGGTNVQSQQHLQMATGMTQPQMLRHATPDQQRLQPVPTQQLQQFPQQLPTIPGHQLASSQMQTGVPGQHQQHPLFGNVNGSNLGPYGISTNLQQQHSTFPMPVGAQFQQSASQMPTNNAMSFPQILQQQQLHQQVNGQQPQQIQIPGQQTLAGITLPTSEGSTPQQFQLPQQYQQYFQNSHSNLPKIPETLGQPPQLVQQQQQPPTVFNGQQNVLSNSVGLPLQLQQLQQRPQAQIQHPQSLQQQTLFQHALLNSGHPQGTTPSAFVQAFNTQTQQAENNTPTASSQQQQQITHQIPANGEQPTNNQNLVIPSAPLELNPQQQVQLQQQQQQFMALQQQMQNQPVSDPNRPAPQQSQFVPQNMQAVMINGSLQWIKTAQPLQLPTPNQQPSATSTETEAPSPTVQHPQQTVPAPVQTPQTHQQQTIPQVIQHLAQVTDQAGNTYIIIAPTQPQQQAQTVIQNGLSAAKNCRAKNSVNCSANGGANHSPGSSSAGNAFSSVGRSAPCPCPNCKEKTTTATALDKYKKVLPYPSANENQLKTIPAIAPKQPISIRPAISKPTNIAYPPKLPTKIARVQAAAIRPPVQLAFAQQNPNPQQPIGLAGGANGGTAPMSSPNIAVVRPMDPLQRLSDQISQIESTFNRLTPPVTSATPPLQTPSNSNIPQLSPSTGPRLTLVTASPPLPPSSSSPQIAASSISPAQHIPHVLSFDPPPVGESPTQIVDITDAVLNAPMPRLTLVDHGTPPPRYPPSSTASPASSPQLSSPGSSIQSISAPTTPVAKAATRTARVKRKVLQVSPSSGGEPEAKTIKLQLHKKNDSESYTIKNIEVNSAKVTKPFKSLKIKAISRSKFTTSEKETDVFVVPIVRLQPNPDPDTNEGNLTIAEGSSSNSPQRDNDGESNALLTQPGGDNNNNNGSRTRLYSYRAVVVWEVQMDKKVLFKSSDVRDVWDRVFQIAQGARLNHNLPPVSYPATNIALPVSQNAAKAMFNDLGLTHKAVQFLLDELPVLRRLSKSNSDKLCPPFPLPVADADKVGPSIVAESEAEEEHQKKSENEETSEELDEGNESGCARFERFRGRKSFDMFGWLTSKHRDPPTECDAPMESLKYLSAPIGMRYRKLKDKAREYLVINTSEIHGRGLFTKRDIEKGEMIIEYAGEVIRPLVCDIREKFYESKAIGCYMFRINDHVIDATMKGNAARFINHSCEPNCEARAVKIFGRDHIIIFSVRRIDRGEELTYDYSFEKEEEKIICTCKSKYCRKYLN